MKTKEQLQEELINEYTKLIELSDSKEFFNIPSVNILKGKLASLKSEQSEKNEKLKCSNCGKVISDCDVSCYYKDEVTEPQPEVKESQSAEEFLFSKYPLVSKEWFKVNELTQEMISMMEQYHNSKRENKQMADMDSILKYLSDNGIGTGTNITVRSCAGLIQSFIAQWVLPNSKRREELLTFMKHYKNDVPLCTMEGAAQLVDEYLKHNKL